MAHQVMVPLPGGGVFIPPLFMAPFCVVHQLAGATAMTAGQIGAADTQQISGDADFVIDKQTFLFAPDGGQLEAQFEIVPGETLHQLAIPLDLLSTPPYPQWFTRVIRRGAQFNFIVDDRRTVQVAAPGAVRALSAGYKLFLEAEPDQPARLYTAADEFRYVSKWTPKATGGPGALGAIPAGGTLPNAINIQATHDFLWDRIAIVCDSTEATLDIQTSTRNRGMFSRACHIVLLQATQFGAAIPAGSLPWELPVPQFIPSTGTIILQAADLGAVGGPVNRLVVMLLGWRLTPVGGLPVSHAALRRIEIEHAMGMLRRQHETLDEGPWESGAALRDEFLGRQHAAAGRHHR